jgi:hypothetical protein
LDSYPKKAKRNLAFAIDGLSGLDFWELARVSEELSSESSKRLLKMAFGQFKYESSHNRLRHTLQCKKNQTEEEATKPNGPPDDSQFPYS